MGSWAELSDLAETKFSALEFGQAVHPLIRALIGTLAHQGNRSVSEWLGPYLQAIISNELPVDVRREVLSGREVPLHWKLRYAPFPRDRIAALMGDQIRTASAALAASPSPLDTAGVPLSDRHEFCAPMLREIQQMKHEPDKRVWFERLAASGYQRKLAAVTPAIVSEVEQLLVSVPNMREATSFVLGQLALAQRGRGAHLALPPMMLVGPPAAGKTWWASEIARALGVHHAFVAMPAVSAAFELAGGNAGWNCSKPGRILRTFLDTQDASPVFVLDELDKMNSGNYAPEPVLLGLIERATAKRFRDEFFDMDFDVSRAIFIATANDPACMDAALRSRFREVQVRAPTKAEREPVIASIWRTIRITHADLDLPEKLPASVMASLVSHFKHARDTQRVIEDGLGRAARRQGLLQLLDHDVSGNGVRSACVGGGVVLAGEFGLH